MKIFKVIVAATAASLASPSMAWNDMGHMTVAAIAWNAMTPEARTRASDLLKLNPDYQDLIADTNTENQNQIAFVRAATWPDQIRSRYDDDTYNPPDKVAKQNIGYADRWIHPIWHFKNIPFSTDGTPLAPPRDVNAQSRIELFSATLADPAASDDVKSYDLVWLLHLVGDVHQPLHAVARFSEQTPHGDGGGNAVIACETVAGCKGKNPDTLHHFWDATIGNSHSPLVAIKKAEAMALAPSVAADVVDPSAWLIESLALAQSRVYQPPIAGGKGPYRIAANYKRLAGGPAEQRVALAGARLARLLNARLQ
jgi:S1/P1 Nuclease